MLRVVISGAGGKLATPIAQAVAEAGDLELSALYNPNRAGAALHGLEVAGDPSQVKGDVVVETSPPSVVLENLSRWRDRGMAAVVGTSGFTPGRLASLRSVWDDAGPCLVVPNFSIGAVLMMRFAREAASHFEVVEVVERHHDTKPDAPSGTALATAMGLSQAGGSSSEVSRELAEGARGAKVEGVRVHSLRLPGLIAQQEVAFSNPGEVFSLEHLSTSYQSFVSGALIAIRRVGDLPPGVHLGLDAVL